MKALSLWQPWASLVALGVKTIETRSWATKYRGPLAIHAAARKPDVEMLEDGPAGEVWDGDECLVQWARTDARDFAQAPSPADRWWLTLGPDHLMRTMPLGRVLATATLVDCLPIRDSMSSDTSGDYIIVGDKVGVGFRGDGDFGMLDQVPYGDFTPGRWAWLLEDIRPLAEPVAASGRQQLWEWTP